jgi:hypothetical protein
VVSRLHSDCQRMGHRLGGPTAFDWPMTRFERSAPAHLRSITAAVQLIAVTVIGTVIAVVIAILVVR